VLGGAERAARARGAWPRARVGFFDGRLEELTPEFPDPPDWVRHGLQSYDGGLRRHVWMVLERRVRDAFGVHADHPVVDAPLLDDQRAHGGVALEPARARDLQTARRDDVPANLARHRDPNALDVGVDAGLRPDQQVPVRLDLPGEAAQHLARTLELEL